MQLRKTPTCESFDPITKTTTIATIAKTSKSYVMEKTPTFESSNLATKITSTTTNIMQVGIMQ
jgi:hypothetical protein